MTKNRVSMRAMPQLHDHDASCDMGGDTSPGVFGHTVIATVAGIRPRAPAAPRWANAAHELARALAGARPDPGDTLVVDVDDERPLIARPLPIILKYLASSHQAFADQVAVLQLVRRCATEIEQDREAAEALGELANQYDVDQRGPFVRAFDESAVAPPIPDGVGANGEPLFTTWELLAMDQVIRVIVRLDRFSSALTEGV
jgi:hypothetical protein